MEPLKQKALVLFVREPEIGTVKTRLVQGGLHESYVLELYKAFIQDVIKIAAQAAVDQIFIYVAFHKIKTGFFDAYRNQFQIRYQEGEHLGDRMFNAMMDCFLADFTDIVVIGSDCLTLKPLDIDEAFMNLEHAEVTLGPSSDGGYYLIGLNALDRELFKDVEWGTERVLEQTRAKIQHLDYDCLDLDEKDDIDTPEDLEAFAQTSPLDFPAEHTRRLLSLNVVQE